jgi:peptidyl-prolyl cis-trans isomerase SurA
MIKKILFYSIILTLLSFKLYSMDSVSVKVLVNNEIITNVDIENEAQYLLALNNRLKNLNNETVLSIAKDSIVKEMIKKIEIEKYFLLDQKNSKLKDVIKSFYTRLKLKNENEFENYLKQYNLTINEIKKKVEIETTWNQLIYDRYKNQLNINTVQLKNEINKLEISKKTLRYLLSEIVFEKNKTKSLENTIKDINISISEIGFENTANIYSISDSSKFGGSIGWVEEKNLSGKMSKIVAQLKIGERTTPIQTGNNFLLLKLDNIKEENVKINKENELKKRVQFEKNKQLEQYSKIYYNKVKINTNINEY